MRVVLLVLDSVGVGANPDAASFGDLGANTLGNLARHVGGVQLPVLGSLGLGNIIPIEGVHPASSPRAAFGRAMAKGAGKDTTTGHWELSGVVVEEPLTTFGERIPAAVIAELEQVTGRRMIGGHAASGTKIIEDLGDQHIRTGQLIVYTSADSVIQIAAHEDVVPIAELYDCCRAARRVADQLGVGRVIARPFENASNGVGFSRTSRRRDFSMQAPGETVLDSIADSGREVVAIGKVDDIFAQRGITRAIHTSGNDDGMQQTLAAYEELVEGLIFTNLVDFDVLYGHRRDPLGYARCLETFDAGLEELLGRFDETEDLLIITADHGNDPTMPGTDHTREYVPILAVRSTSAAGRQLKTRESFADIGATVAEALGVESKIRGKSFWQELI